MMMKKVRNLLLVLGLGLCLCSTAMAEEMTVTLEAADGSGEQMDISLSNVTKTEEVKFDFVASNGETSETVPFEGTLYYLGADCEFGGYYLSGYALERTYDEEGNFLGVFCDATGIVVLTPPIVDGGKDAASWLAGDMYVYIGDEVLVALDTSTVTEEMLEALKQPSFSDVPVDAPYADAVDWAVNMGITTGTTPTTFGPDATCTRGQVVTFLYRFMGEPEVTSTENPFSDVKEDSPYYKAILWAVEEGITNGYPDGAFHPNETCTGAQVMTFLYRATAAEDFVSESSVYAENVNPVYAPGIDFAAGLGLLEGLDFVADDPSPRSDIVSCLYEIWMISVVGG